MNETLARTQPGIQFQSSFNPSVYCPSLLSSRMLLRRVGLTALSVLAPVALAVALAVYRLDPFDPAPLPLEEIFSHEVVVAPRVNGRLLLDSELLHVTTDSEVKLLTDEAEGRKFKLTDGVDIAKDGTVYFTDASWKYSLHDSVWEFLEGRPHGKLLSFNPITGETRVLARDLYFPNGVVVSPLLFKPLLLIE